jgi:hypothetical protein
MNARRNGTRAIDPSNFTKRMQIGTLDNYSPNQYDVMRRKEFERTTRCEFVECLMRNIENGRWYDVYLLPERVIQTAPTERDLQAKYHCSGLVFEPPNRILIPVHEDAFSMVNLFLYIIAIVLLVAGAFALHFLLYLLFPTKYSNALASLFY